MRGLGRVVDQIRHHAGPAERRLVIAGAARVGHTAVVWAGTDDTQLLDQGAFECDRDFIARVSAGALDAVTGSFTLTVRGGRTASAGTYPL